MGLFSGKPENKPSQETTSSPRERAPSPVPRASTEAAPTVIGRDAVIKGELSSKNDMLIEGRVEGKILGNQRVVIGETGTVQAHVHANIVTVRGEVHGDCEGTNKVEITATGKVFGNISAEAIVVAEGATFRGTSKMMKASQPKPIEAPSRTQTDKKTSSGQPTSTDPPPATPTAS